MAAGTTYVALATTTLTSASSTVSFNSISGSYTDLIIVTNHGNVTDGSGFYIRFNSDTGSNYSNVAFGSNGSSALAYSVTNDTQIPMNWQYNGFGTSLKNAVIIHINGYANTSCYKTILARMRSVDDGGTSITQEIVGTWRNTSTVTTIALTGNSNFISGSSFTLYGIAAA